MIKKTVEFENFFGVKIKKDFYFNIRKDELITMQFEEEGGLDKFLIKMENEKDSKKIMRMFEKFLKVSYGEISPDGNKFIKSEEIWENFHSSNAYEIIYMELISDPNKLSNFIDSLIPKFSQNEISAIQSNQAKVNNNLQTQ